LERDKAGNAEAVIRFLPPSEGEDAPWAQYFSHSFQGPGGWYIENCPTTIGKKCPLCAANNELWNTGTEESQTQARNRKRKLHYISNILVVEDPNHPENNGKVFLFKYGKKIHEKVIKKMQPVSTRETPVNPFHPVEGANLILRIKTVGVGKDRFPNYDDSTFEAPSAISKNNADIEKIWNQQYKLAEFTDPAKFKEYDVLEERLNLVLSAGAAKRTVTSPKTYTSSAAAPAKSAPPWEKSSVSVSPKVPIIPDTEEDADTMLSRLMSEDE
jgi:hypothetical protein